MAHLWTGDEPPAEYIVLQLCRLWHCPPSVVRREALIDGLQHLMMVSVENEIAQREAKRAQRQARSPHR